MRLRSEQVLGHPIPESGKDPHEALNLTQEVFPFLRD